MIDIEKFYAALSDVLDVSKEDIENNLQMEESESWDSLKHMELISMIETNYQITLSMDEIVKMTSIQEIKNIVLARN